MKLLKNAGKAVILATWPSPETNEHCQQYLEKAGRTCYQSEKGEITDATASAFVKKVMKRGHYSVIEHGWRGYIFTFEDTPQRKANDNRDAFLMSLYPELKHLFITCRQQANKVLVSANLETWRKLVARDAVPIEIVKELSEFAPTIFEDFLNTVTDPFILTDVSMEVIQDVEQLHSDRERLVHMSSTVQFNNVSRGVTHELVRHRVPVFSQESTRYVDESDFNVVVPPHRAETAQVLLVDNGEDKLKASFEGFINLSETMYRQLRKAGWAAEDARQMLPIGIKAQIVTSCNLEEWDYIFKKRTEKVAHWEIRRLMTNLLIEMQRVYRLFQQYEVQLTTILGIEGIIPDHTLVKE